MQEVSGAMGKLKIHYEATAAEIIEKQMELFLDWFNQPTAGQLLKAAIAHLWLGRDRTFAL